MDKIETTTKVDSKKSSGLFGMFRGKHHKKEETHTATSNTTTTTATNETTATTGRHDEKEAKVKPEKASKKSKREKEKTKSKKKKKTKGAKDSDHDQHADGGDEGQAEVDAEGYTIRRDSRDPTASGKEDRFYSSDSDSDSDGEQEKKLRITIRPIGPGGRSPTKSASIDELRATVNTLSLSPLTSNSSRRLTGTSNTSSTITGEANHSRGSFALQPSSTSSITTTTTNNSNNQNHHIFSHRENNSSSQHDPFAIFNSSNLSSTTSSSGIKSAMSASNYSSSSAASSSAVANDSSFMQMQNVTNFPRRTSDETKMMVTSTTATSTVMSSTMYSGWTDGQPTTGQQQQDNNSFTVPDRYADLTEIFKAVESSPTATAANGGNVSGTGLGPFGGGNDMTTTATAARNLTNTSPFSLMGPPMSGNLYRPANRRAQLSANPILNPSQQQPPTSSSTNLSHAMSRCQSFGNIPTSNDCRMTPVSFGSSRGPSPLTIGYGDVVPLAVAFQEAISVCFKGSDENKCQMHLIGSIKIAFPTGILQVFTTNPNPPVLAFRLSKSTLPLSSIHPNKELVENWQKLSHSCENIDVELNMIALATHLRRLAELSPNNRYYNVDVIRYQIKVTPGAKTVPLQLASFWRGEETCSLIRVDYKYNSDALSSPQALKNLTFSLNLDSNVSNVASTPTATWNAALKQASWKVDQLSLANELGYGSLRVKLDHKYGPISPVPCIVQFGCTDATISGMEFSLVGAGYRMSLVKKQIATGRYMCEPEIR